MQKHTLLLSYPIQSNYYYFLIFLFSYFQILYGQLIKPVEKTKTKNPIQFKKTKSN